MKPTSLYRPTLLRSLASILAIPFLLTLGAGCSTKTLQTGHDPSKAEVLPLVGNIQVHRYKLENGLKILVVEDHTSPTFAYQTWFQVGSRDEKPGQTGLAHLFEHMMFKGTKTLKEGEFDRTLEAAGAEGENAFTSRDYTAYVQQLPSDRLDLIARLEADRMVNLVVNEKSFKTETEVVQNERRFRNENSPDGLIYQEIFGLAFKKHSYRWPVIGYQEDLSAMTAQNAIDFYHGYYSPNHATIVVVGDVKPDQVYKTIKKYYGHYPAQQAPETLIVPEPPQTSARRKVMKLNIQVEKLALAYHIPEVTHPDIPAIMTFQALLTEGKTSRLKRALIETGIASMIESYGIDDKDPSVMILVSNMQRGKTATQAESIIMREIARLSKEQVSAQELTRAKNTLSFSLYQALDDNSSKANFLGLFETVTGDFQTGANKIKQIENVTAEDIQRVVRKYFEPRNRSVIVGSRK